MDRKRSKPFTPILLFYIAINGFFIIGRRLLEQWQADQDVLIIGNLLLFLITFISYTLSKRGIGKSNPYAFVRSVYSGIIIKLFACIIAAFVYISVYKSQLSKTALFICMGLYLVYTFMEVSTLMKLLKNKTHE